MVVTCTLQSFLVHRGCSLKHCLTGRDPGQSVIYILRNVPQNTGRMIGESVHITGSVILLHVWPVLARSEVQCDVKIVHNRHVDLDLQLQVVSLKNSYQLSLDLLCQSLSEP